MATVETQGELSFGNDPWQFTGLIRPEYWRKNPKKIEHEGISPREAFYLASELRQLGHSEDEIDGDIAKWAKEERAWMRRLLGKIGTGHIRADEIHQENANLMRTALVSPHGEQRGLTPMEQLWWWYELNVGRLKERKRLRSRLQEGDVICIDKTHALLGKFRDHMPETYKNMKE